MKYALGLAVLALSACTIDDVAMQTGAPVTPIATATATATAASSPAPGMVTTTTTTRRPDGSTVTTTQTVDTTQPSVARLAGTWQAKDADGSQCRLTLEPEQRFGGRGLSGACLGARLFRAGAWDLRGNSLIIMDSFGEDIATLTQSQPGLWTGGGITLWR